MTTQPLVAFLRARLDEDEQYALAAGERSRRWKLAAFDDQEIGDVGDLVIERDATLNPIELRHAQRHDPARVLREVQAKRAMLAELTRWPFDYRPECDDQTHLFVRLLALPYSDHPDYQPEWAL